MLNENGERIKQDLGFMLLKIMAKRRKCAMTREHGNGPRGFLTRNHIKYIDSAKTGLASNELLLKCMEGEGGGEKLLGLARLPCRGRRTLWW